MIFSREDVHSIIPKPKNRPEKIFQNEERRKMKRQLAFTAVFAICYGLVGFTGCKREASTPSQKVVLKKNPKDCKILRSFKTRNVSLHVSKKCFEKGSNHLHLSALFPMDRIDEASRDIIWYLKEVFGKQVSMQAIQRTRATKGGRHWLLIVYRLEKPGGVRFR